MRAKNFEQVLILKCIKCKKTQGRATRRTQEQLNEEQQAVKNKPERCIFCHTTGKLIDIFIIKGISDGQSAKEIIKKANEEIHSRYTLDFN